MKGIKIEKLLLFVVSLTKIIIKNITVEGKLKGKFQLKF